MTWESLAENFYGRGAKGKLDAEIFLVTYRRTADKRKDSRYLCVYIGSGVCERTGFQVGDRVDFLLDRQEMKARIEAVNNGSRGWVLISDYKKSRHPRSSRVPGVHFTIPIKPGMIETDIVTRGDGGRSTWVPQRLHEVTAGSVEFHLDRKKVRIAK